MRATVLFLVLPALMTLPAPATAEETCLSVDTASVCTFENDWDNEGCYVSEGTTWCYASEGHDEGARVSAGETYVRVADQENSWSSNRTGAECGGVSSSHGESSSTGLDAGSGSTYTGAWIGSYDHVYNDGCGEHNEWAFNGAQYYLWKDGAGAYGALGGSYYEHTGSYTYCYGSFGGYLVAYDPEGGTTVVDARRYESCM